MNINYNLNISDIINIIAIIITMIGGIFALFKWKNNRDLNRASKLFDLVDISRTDRDIKKIMNMIDYNKSWYNENFHSSIDLQLQVDKTLSFYSNICYMKKKKILSKDEFIFFEYQINRILSNDNVKNYLYNYYHFSKKIDTTMSFIYLLKYGEKQNFLDNDFFDKEAYNKGKYNHYLNF